MCCFQTRNTLKNRDWIRRWASTGLNIVKKRRTLLYVKAFSLLHPMVPDLKPYHDYNYRYWNSCIAFRLEIPSKIEINFIDGLLWSLKIFKNRKIRMLRHLAFCIQRYPMLSYILVRTLDIGIHVLLSDSKYPKK